MMHGARLGAAAGLLGFLVVVAGQAALPRPPSPAQPTVPAAQAHHGLPAGIVPLLATALATEQPADYAVVPLAARGDGFRAANPAHHLTAAFLPEGVAITPDNPTGAAADTWAMRLAATGDGGALVPVAAASPVLNGARIEYRRGNVTEWYLNGPLGVEQGFTLGAPPPGPRTGDLVLAVDVTGAVATESPTAGVVLTLPNGAQRRYGHLAVTDATGRALPARLTARDTAIEIGVDDRGATYPLLVDPFIQEQELTASDPATGDSFGWSAAVSADGATAVVGASTKNGSRGAAYVFVRSGGAWTQQQKLLPNDPAASDTFGSAVTISANGTTALIGAQGKNSQTGAAYVFVRSGTVWTQQQELAADDGAANDNLGNAAAVSGDGNTALLGAYGKGGLVGVAYVFVRSGVTWTQQQKLLAGDQATGDSFGDAAALSADGNTALLGADGKNSSTGAAYVFVRSGATWSQQQKLTASDGAANDLLGYAAALSGDGTTAVLGAPGKGNHTGAAYVFVRSGATWSQQQALTAVDGTVSDNFGSAVAASADGGTAAVGALGKNAFAGGDYLFARTGAAWALQQKLTASDAAPNDNLGRSVAISGNGAIVVAGAANKNGGAGTAYAFVSAVLPPLPGPPKPAGPGNPGTPAPLPTAPRPTAPPQAGTPNPLPNPR